MACGRALINRQDGSLIGKALSKLVNNVKRQYKDYILVDFDDAEANAFVEGFGKDMYNILHFLRSVMRVARLVNPSASPGYHIFMNIARKIPDEPSKEVVD